VSKERGGSKQRSENVAEPTDLTATSRTFTIHTLVLPAPLPCPKNNTHATRYSSVGHQRVRGRCSPPVVRPAERGDEIRVK